LWLLFYFYISHTFSLTCVCYCDNITDGMPHGQVLSALWATEIRRDL